ncbi:hypothetical protein ACHAXS_009942 [Conticribra weissflogii]
MTPWFNRPNLLLALAFTAFSYKGVYAFDSRVFHSASTFQRAPAFVPFQLHLARKTHPSQHTALFSQANPGVENDPKSSNKVTIQFYSEISRKSDPAPRPPEESSKSIHDFFRLPDTPLLLLRGSKDNAVIEIDDPDPKVLEAYALQCSVVNASAPAPNDRIFDVTTSGVKFPGLEIKSQAIIGGKLISVKEERDGEEMPCFQFVLIQDSTYATGSRFLVWLFNKITGNSNNASDNGEKDIETGSQTTTSLNRVSALSVNNGAIEFECNASLGVKMQFPALMMKLIPDGKDKSEKSGSASLRKALETDVPVSLARFRDAYCQWLER